MSLKLESAQTHTLTLRCTSPGWMTSLHLLRLLSRLRFRAPAASSGSGPAGKPAPPATPAPPRSPPASDRDASFSGQGEPAAAPAALAAVVRSTSPREARGSERTSASCGGVGKTPSAARAASLSVGPCLSHAHTSTRARCLQRSLGTRLTATCARVFAVNQSAWVLDPPEGLKGGAPPADTRP